MRTNWLVEADQRFCALHRAAELRPRLFNECDEAPDGHGRLSVLLLGSRPSESGAAGVSLFAGEIAGPQWTRGPVGVPSATEK
jgi:hypothetical protein